jgi:hypothetical protein
VRSRGQRTEVDEGGSDGEHRDTVMVAPASRHWRSLWRPAIQPLGRRHKESDGWQLGYGGIGSY